HESAMTVVLSVLPRSFLHDLVRRDRVQTFVICRTRARRRSRFYLHSPLLLGLPLSFRFLKVGLRAAHRLPPCHNSSILLTAVLTSLSVCSISLELSAPR